MWSVTRSVWSRYLVGNPVGMESVSGRYVVGNPVGMWSATLLIQYMVRMENQINLFTITGFRNAFLRGRTPTMRTYNADNHKKLLVWHTVPFFPRWTFQEALGPSGFVPGCTPSRRKMSPARCTKRQNPRKKKTHWLGNLAVTWVIVHEQVDRSVCGWYVVGKGSRYVVSMWSVRGRYVVGTWSVCGRYTCPFQC